MDRRAVDSIIEVKSSESSDTSFAQVSERAKTLFSLQDDRRCVLLAIDHILLSHRPKVCHPDSNEARYI
jgi:hypothetical protein